MSWGVRDIEVAYGSTAALQSVDMDIEPGQIHALIGGDGAGKSTLLKVLAGLDVGQTGAADLPSADRIGYVPSAGGIFGDLTVAENLEFVADAHRLTDWRTQADALLIRADLDPFGDRIAGKMSGGQRRKLAGAMAMLPQPDLLILDEMTTGVDPMSRMELWRLITGAAAAGAAVVASTTYLDEAERAGAVTMLHAGLVLASGSPTSITAAVPGSIVDCAEPTDRQLAWRRGARWRQWDPHAESADGLVTLEDAAIVFEIMQGREAA